MSRRDVRVLTVRQPWASLISSGRKTIEVRSWRTDFRGALVIHAGMGVDLEHSFRFDDELPAGVILSVVDLVDVRPLSASDRRAACLAAHDKTLERFAWVLRDPIALPPITMRGALGLRRAEAKLAAAVQSARRDRPQLALPLLEEE